MKQLPDRKLATQEIELLIFLRKAGADGHKPIMLLSGARERATQLWGLGLIDVWYRQSLGRGKPEGPFYSLTSNGRERATALFLSRQSREALSTDPKDFASRIERTQPTHQGASACRSVATTLKAARPSRETSQSSLFPPTSPSAPPTRSDQSTDA